MQRWENVDPAELARRNARRVNWPVILGWGGAFLVSCAFWTVLVVCYVIGQR